MRRPKGRASGQTGRATTGWTGHPGVGRRENRRRFWAAVARGLSSEAAGVEAGVPPGVGSRWFREGGGMPTVTQAPPSGRYLSLAEREEIAILRAGGHGVREIARTARPLAVDDLQGAATATPRPAAGTAPRSRSCTPSGARGGRRPPSSWRTRSCATTCRSGSPARSAGPTARRCQGPRSRHGRAATGRAARTAGGRSRGAPSRYRTACAWTSPMMGRCGSPTRRSTSRSTCRAGGRCAASWPPACGPAGRCASPGPAPVVAAKAS